MLSRFILPAIKYAFYQMFVAVFFFLFHKGLQFGNIPRTRRRKNCLHMPTVRRLSKARRAEKWQFNLCTDTLARRKEGCQEPEGKWKWLNNDENNDGGQRGGGGAVCLCVRVCACVRTDNEERLLVNIKLEYKGRRKSRRRLQTALPLRHGCKLGLQLIPLTLPLRHRPLSQ